MKILRRMSFGGPGSLSPSSQQQQQKDETSTVETRSTSTNMSSSHHRKKYDLGGNVQRSSLRSVSSEDSDPCSSISLSPKASTPSRKKHDSNTNTTSQRRKVNRRASLSRLNSEPVLQQTPVVPIRSDGKGRKVKRSSSSRSIDSNDEEAKTSGESTSMFHHSLLVDKTWGQVKSCYFQGQADSSPAQQKLLLGEQIVLHMMEKDPAVRQQLNITSFRSPSPYLDELCNALVALVDQLVSFMGPDMMMNIDHDQDPEDEHEQDIFTQELTSLARDCQARGIQFNLLGPAISESIALALSSADKPLREEDRQAWTQFLKLALNKMQKLLSRGPPPTRGTITIGACGTSASSLLTASTDGEAQNEHDASE